jgi:hypothetical protein
MRHWNMRAPACPGDAARGARAIGTDPADLLAAGTCLLQLLRTGLAVEASAIGDERFDLV